MKNPIQPTFAPHYFETMMPAKVALSAAQIARVSLSDDDRRAAKMLGHSDEQALAYKKLALSNPSGVEG